MAPTPTTASIMAAPGLPFQFLHDQRAATAIEYALMAGSIAVVIAATVFAIGNTVQTNYYDRILTAFTG